MTTATFKQEGTLFDVVIEGHSGYNNAGPDLVCAACSTLSYTLLQEISMLEEQGALITMSTETTDGRMEIAFEAKRRSLRIVQEVVQTVIGGFALLAHQYRDYVKLLVENKK